MFDLGPEKLVLVSVVAVLVLGPDKLPDAARRVGATWRSFNEFRHRMEAEVRTTMPDLPSSGELARMSRSPASLLHHLADKGADTIDLWASGSSSPNLVPSESSHSPADGTALVESPPPTVAVPPGDANLN